MSATLLQSERNSSASEELWLRSRGDWLFGWKASRYCESVQSLSITREAAVWVLDSSADDFNLIRRHVAILSASYKAMPELGPPIRNQAAIDVLRSFLSDDEGEQAETWEYLKADLDEHRPDDQKLFP